MTANAYLRRAWKRRGPWARALSPVAWVYGALAQWQRGLYASGQRTVQRADVPVIVVGNVIAGGAGKTPVTIAVVQHLQACGWHPGVVSRGYGRRTTDCREVHPDSKACDVGDEPALIARRTGVPVFVAHQRYEAVQALRRTHPQSNIIVCDDGLQHWALARDFEICVFNDEGIGNGLLLPAGPLREPWPRPVNAVLHTAPAPPPGTQAPAFALERTLADSAVDAHGCTIPLQALRGQPLQAVAAIARPEDFFAMLRAQGLHLESTLALPDHYNFDSFSRFTHKGLKLICTEKDALKLWPRYPNALAVGLQLRTEPGFFALLDASLDASLSSTA